MIDFIVDVIVFAIQMSFFIIMGLGWAYVLFGVGYHGKSN